MITTKQRKNRKLLITLMEYVGKLETKFQKKLFDMSTFQHTGRENTTEIKKNKKDIIECGTTCCVSGWIAQCPAFQEQGVVIDSYDGSAHMSTCFNPETTFMSLFGINKFRARGLICGTDHNLMGYPNGMITISQVIRVIKSWR